MNNFFYDLNKRLATLASKQDAEQITESAKAQAPRSKLAESMGVAEADYSAKKAAAGKDIGKPGKNFAKIAKGAAERYGSKAAGERVAGAVLNKLRHADEGNEFSGALANAKKDHKSEFKVSGKTYPVQEGHCSACNCSPCACNSMEESAFQAYKGKKKFGDAGMKALQKAGREGASDKTMNNIRNRYDKYDESTGQADEGNAFTAALKATPKGGKFKVGSKEFTDTSDLEEGFKEMDAWMASREKEKGTGKFDKKERTMPGGMKATTYTRKHEDDNEEDNKDDSKSKQADKYASPKKKGRPKSAASKDSERVTKGSHKYKTVDGKRVKKEKADEGLDSDGVMMTRPTNCSSESVDPGEQAEYNDEAGMTKESLHTIVRHARELEKCLRDNENLPEWVQEKVGQIKGMMTSVTDYILSTHERDAEQHMEPMAEKAVSQAQRRAAGIAHAAQKGKIPKSRLRGASKEMAKMPQGELHKFAATKEKGLPNKVKEGGKPDFLDLDKDGNKTEPMKKAAKEKSSNKDEKVDETTVAGSVATAPAAAKKSAGGYNFGGGVYEGFNNQVESMITEGMNITVNMTAGEDGESHKSITVTAEGEEADQLATLLKMAGLQGQTQEACGTCGNTPCGCEQTVDEAYGDTDETLNNPDYPTNTETLAAQPELRT
jgi:uncharacterized protein YoxC